MKYRELNIKKSVIQTINLWYNRTKLNIEENYGKTYYFVDIKRNVRG